MPVTDEPLGARDAYGDDRVFCYLRDMDEPDEALDARVKALADAGQPTVTLSAGGPGDLGRIFFFAEFATAVAGWALEINPFDQPDVQDAKDTTGRILGDSGAARSPSPPTPTTTRCARCLPARPPAYVALLGFMAPSEESTRRSPSCAPRSATHRRATTFGYGPRYLHSTGQLHKGGPPTGASSCSSTTATRTPRSRAAVPLRDAEQRAGGRRPGDPARARRPGRAAAARRRSGRAGRRSPLESRNSRHPRSDSSGSAAWAATWSPASSATPTTRSSPTTATGGTQQRGRGTGARPARSLADSSRSSTRRARSGSWCPAGEPRRDGRQARRPAGARAT